MDASIFTVESSVEDVQLVLSANGFSAEIRHRFRKFDGKHLIGFAAVTEFPGYPFDGDDQDEDTRLFQLIRAAQRNVAPAQAQAPAAGFDPVPRPKKDAFMKEKDSRKEQFLQKAMKPLSTKEDAISSSSKVGGGAASSGHIGSKRGKMSEVNKETGYSGSSSSSNSYELDSETDHHHRHRRRGGGDYDDDADDDLDDDETSFGATSAPQISEMYGIFSGRKVPITVVLLVEGLLTHKPGTV
jgi:hypothetical protein